MMKEKFAAVKGRRGYFLPSGGALPGETPEETGARQLREEPARAIVIRFDENGIAEELFHECHKWAINQPQHQTGIN